MPLLDEVFYWIFNMSIAASLSGAVVLLLRLIKAIPRRVIKVAWIIPFIRFWIPIGISGKYGLMTLISKFAIKTVTVYRISEDKAFTMANSVMGAESYFPITYKVNVLENVFTVSSYIWSIICAAIVLTVTVLYVLTVSETRGAIPYTEKRVYLSDKITSPAVFGILKPKIMIPTAYAAMDKDSLKYVLMHERMHIKSCDNLWRMLAFATAAVHWFNPLVWILLKCFLSDTEYACDEKVLSGTGEVERKKYAETLVNCAENRIVFVSAFGGAKLRTRVERILSFKKISAVSAVLFAAFIGIIAYILLTNAV